MTKRALIACAALAAFSVGGVSAAENPCAYEEARFFPFPTWEDAGAATIRIVGGDCRSSTLAVSLRDADGNEFYAHATPLRALTAINADAIGAHDVVSITDRVWRLLGPMRTGDLVPWERYAEGYDDEAPAVDEKEYAAARDADAPYFCITSGYEGGVCYWRKPGEDLVRLLWLSDLY